MYSTSLNRLESELIRELRSAPISELESAINVAETGLIKIMNEIGVEAIDNWNVICAGNIFGIIEEIVHERRSKDRALRIRTQKIRFMPSDD